MGNPHMDRIAEILANDVNVTCKKTLVIAGANIGAAMIGTISSGGDFVAKLRESLGGLGFSSETITDACNAARPFAQIATGFGAGAKVVEGTGRS
jgi:hypothetical protein